MAYTANEPFVFLEVKGLPQNAFHVVSFSGTEAISTPFSFEFDVVSAERDLEFEQVLGNPAHVRIRGIGGERHVHGIVRRIDETSRSAESTRFAIVVVPSLWKLSLSQNSRIFQEKSVPDVVAEVLDKAKVPSDEVNSTVHGNHAPWEYCVQYRESDLDFVSRLLEQEGIFYFFEHCDSKAILRMGDAPADHPPSPCVGTLPVRPGAGMMDGTEETVLRLVVSEEVRPDSSAVRDYNFKNPPADLTGLAREGPGLNTEVYDAPAEYDLPDEGREVAKLRLQELRATRRVCSGETTCNRLVPGHTFEVSKHPRQDLNRKFLILEVNQQGSQPQVLGEEGLGLSSSYSCTFRCIPSDVPYRPPRTTPRPLAQGSQTAIVVGPAGEEIHTDEYGRIKVQFHWDREGKKDDKSSCWIRVAQAWAGAGWGTFFLPRIDQEVIVGFLDGDPDQPIVTGCVYNADNMPPYPLDSEKTKSTIRSNSSKGGDGYNEIRFEDLKGAEQIFVHAQRNRDIEVENDETTHVKHDRTETVDNDERISIGKNRTEDVGDNESITIGKNRTESVGENETVDIGKDRTLSVGKNESITVGDSRTDEVAKNETISIGKRRQTSVGEDDLLQVGKKLLIDAGDQITIRTGSASITMRKDGTITVNGKNVMVDGSGKITVKAAGDVIVKGSKVLQN